MARIFVLEDDESIGALICATLSAAGHDPTLFTEHGQIENGLAAEIPRLLLLDIMLPGKDGWAVLKEWKARPSTREVPVIVLSAKSEELDKVRGLEGGAEDYITKPFGILELQARVKAALRRTPMPNEYQVRDLTVNLLTKEVKKNSEIIRLTHKETELMEYLCKNAGQVLSREQLLDAVWGYAFAGDTTRTVDFHVRTLRQKLGDSADEPEYIETVRGFGYRLKKDEST